MSNSKKLYVQRYVFLFLALVVMLFIFWHSSKDAASSTSESKNFTKTLFGYLIGDFSELSQEEQYNLVVEAQHFIRKSAHFCIYAALGFFVMGTVNTYTLTKKFKFLIAESVCFIYAISDEIHQIFIPGRAGRVTDVLIDSVGGLFGIIAMVVVLFVYSKLKKKEGKV